MPQSASLANRYTAQYDAWNRRVELKNGTTTVATYRYDGATRRVTKWVGSNTTHFHYFDRSTIARFLEARGFRVERIATAAKPLTPDYVAGQVEVFYPALAAGAGLLRRLPRSLRERTIHVPVGEMLVLARRSDA